MGRAAVLPGLLLLSVSAQLFGGGPSAASDDCADVTVPLRMFKIEVKWSQPSYPVGSLARLKVKVTRTAEEDPATAEGMPWPMGRPLDEPAEGVVLGAAVFVGDVYLNGGGTTDAAGKATVPVKIENYTKPGVGQGRIFGEKILVDDFPHSSCRVLIQEWGRLDPIPKVRITN